MFTLFRGMEIIPAQSTEQVNTVWSDIITELLMDFYTLWIPLKHIRKLTVNQMY